MPLSSDAHPLTPRRHVAAWLALMLAFTGALTGALITSPSAQAATQTTQAAALPDVIPSIDNFKPGAGSFTAAPGLSIVDATTDGAFKTTTELLAHELATALPGAQSGTGAGAAGDIVLRLDASRTDLGAEGYALDISDRVTITAAQPVGVFYGTRTVLQMLTQHTELPQGTLIDVPKFKERGVTLCACVINISPQAIDALIDEMAYLKLNTLLLEMKVKVDKYPASNTWSYYTKDQVKALVAKASARGIDVIPEINSPGHMGPWLPARPDLQLVSKDGVADPDRMDITKDASFEYYADLIDEYSEVFTSKYWHMGMDEYMLGSGFANYPQLLEAAHSKFGPDANENDLVAWYANRINAYVKSKGKVMRVWNDGIVQNNKVVPLDRDIHIEHWTWSPISSQSLVDQGYTVTNVSNSLYMVRGGYTVDAAGLYAKKWSPLTMWDGTIAANADRVTGARISAWPDGGTPQEAENTQLNRMFEPLRFVAQATWSNSHPWATYADFKTAMDAAGHNPAWGAHLAQPVENGTFTLEAPGGAGALAPGSNSGGSGNAATLSPEGETLSITQANDGYYTITAADGRCLDLDRTGALALNVPADIGANVTFAACDDTTMQRWSLRAVEGGFEIVNAASQMGLVVSKGLTNVPVPGQEPRTIADGKVVQAPSDWVRTTWTLSQHVSLAVSASATEAQFGDQVKVEYTVKNPTQTAVAGATLHVASVPDGWTATPQTVALGDLAPGASQTGTVTLTNVSGGGPAQFSFEVRDAAGVVVATSSASLAGVCSTSALRPTAVTAVDSEQTSGEPAPSGPGAAAIDGDTATYWHTQWSPDNAPYPHAIVVDLGTEQNICGIKYTGRDGIGNGRIGDYEVYTSTSVSTLEGDWGAAATAGTFANTDATQSAEFASRTARYVKLVALNEVNGNPWATVAELAAIGPAPAPLTFAPALAVPAQPTRVGASWQVTGSGYAPGENVALTLERGNRASTPLGATQADASGAINATLAVPKGTRPGSGQLTGAGQTSGASTMTKVAVRGG